MAALPPPSKNSQASILLEERVVRFDEEEGQLVARQFSRTLTRVHSAGGQDRRSVAVNYSSTFSSIEALQARITNPDGSVIDVDSAAVDLPSLGTYMLYDDSRYRALKVPTVAPGAVVEGIVIERTTQPEIFAFSHLFGNDIPVQASSFVVDAPAGWELDSLSDVAPEKELVNGRQRLIWRRENLPAIKPASWAPSVAERAELVSVRLRRAVLTDGSVVAGPADDVELSRSSAALMAASTKVTPEIKGIVHDVLGDDWASMPQRERAGKLYAWTRDSIRYCAIEIGMGGWIPHASDEVERLRYGDCKDKANLLKALLTAVDVKSRLVTIYSSVAPRPFRLPVIAANFNHAILVVDLDDGPVFVDPTTRTVAFADLPPNDEDRMCLPIDASGSPLVPTPASSPTTDYRHAQYRLTAGADGQVTGKVEATLAGHFADRFREGLLETPESKWRDLYRSALGSSFSFDGATLTNERPPVFVTPVGVAGDVHLDRGGDTDSLSTLWRASELLEAQAPLIDPERPDVALMLWANEAVVDVVEITLPESFRIKQLPEPVSYDSPLLSYRVEWVGGETLTLKRSLTFHQNRVEAKDVAALRQALAGYFRAFEARAVLTKTAKAKTSSTSPAPTPPSSSVSLATPAQKTN